VKQFGRDQGHPKRITEWSADQVAAFLDYLSLEAPELLDAEPAAANGQH
jgi:hypothetical protein